MRDLKTLDERVVRWRRSVAPYLRHAPDPPRATTALLVIDMQRHFERAARPILGRCISAIAACRAESVPVIFTRHGHVDPRRDGGMLAAWWGDLIASGSAEHAFLQGAEPKGGETVIDKARYSAFHGTDLDARLRRAGVTDVAVCGVLTNLCCESTARDAFSRDFRVHFLLDCTAAETDAMHVASLVNLSYGFAHVRTAADFTVALTRSGSDLDSTASLNKN